MIGSIASTHNCLGNGMDIALSCVVHQLEQTKLTAEVVEYEDVFVECIADVRGIILGFMAILDGNVLKIANSVEGGIAIEAAVLLIFTFYLEQLDELVESISDGVVIVNGMLPACAIR